MRVAIVIPVFNERELLPRLFERLEQTPRPRMPDGTECERIVVLSNDGSTDGSGAIVETLAETHDHAHAVHAEVNRGKGSALNLGITRALKLGADVVLIQDADLEYDPRDHDAVLAPLLDGRADAIIGTRFQGQTHRVLYFWHQLANRVISLTSNMLSNLNLSDIECGFKAFSRRVIERIEITEPRFGVEPELVAKLAKLRLSPAENPDAPPAPIRIFEVPVSYAGRTYAEGKKIGWRDGVEAIWCIFKHNM